MSNETTPPTAQAAGSENRLAEIRRRSSTLHGDGYHHPFGAPTGAAMDVQWLLALMDRVADWKAIADDLASALARLDALYRSEQDPEAPTARPEWLRHPWQRYHRALADEENAKANDGQKG